MPREEEFKLLLGVPNTKRMLTLVPVGIPAELPSVEKKSLAEVLYWEKYATHDNVT